MPYDTPAPGVRQKRPEVVRVSSKLKGDYYIVRRFETGIAPIGHVVFRGSREDCQAFVDNGCKVLPKKAPKKKAAKK
jgi:hypothetical protein